MTNHTDLIARLKGVDSLNPDDCWLSSHLYREAATALEALSQREGKETIIAAAIRFTTPDEFRGQQGYPDELIVSAPPPARHHSLMHPMFNLTGKRTATHDQGFITSTGRYVSREEAHAIAVASRQPLIDHHSRIGGVLYSEDIW